jgi:hypothetical protein
MSLRRAALLQPLSHRPRCDVLRSDARLSYVLHARGAQVKPFPFKRGESLKHLVPPREGSVRHPKRAACSRNPVAQALLTNCRPASPNRCQAALAPCCGCRVCKARCDAVWDTVPRGMHCMSAGNVCLVGLAAAQGECGVSLVRHTLDFVLPGRMGGRRVHLARRRLTGLWFHSVLYCMLTVHVGLCRHSTTPSLQTFQRSQLLRASKSCPLQSFSR